MDERIAFEREDLGGLDRLELALADVEFVAEVLAFEQDDDAFYAVVARVEHHGAICFFGSHDYCFFPLCCFIGGVMLQWAPPRDLLMPEACGRVKGIAQRKEGQASCQPINHRLFITCSKGLMNFMGLLLICEMFHGQDARAPFWSLFLLAPCLY